MEPAQKRQRTAATTMQRISLLPKELQAGILMWAMEPTPSATLMKAAIGDAYGEQSWWATVVGKDHGHQKYLNRHTHCHRLWARALEVRPDGSLAWKWSETNVFVNQSGRAHVRGIWADLENEVAIRRNVRGEPPIDQYVMYELARALYIQCPPPDSKAAVVTPHEALADTCGYVIVNRPADGRLRLEWAEHATRIARIYTGMWHTYEEFSRRVQELER